MPSEEISLPDAPFRTSVGDVTVTPVTLDVFFDTLLPRVPVALDEQLRSIGGRRKTFKSLVTKNGRLWGYSQRSPSEIDSDAYIGIQRCVRKLSKLKGVSVKTPTVSFVHVDQETLDSSEIRSSHPDAYFTLARHDDRTRLPPWRDIAVPGAYTQVSYLEEVYQNNGRIVRIMANCLMRDPRRRFVLGFTAQDSRMRLWYCDRSQIVCSQAFDFISDSRFLFRFVLSCLLADPHELGFDPTMIPRPTDDDSKIQYDILVQSGQDTRVYRTLDLIFDAGSGRLLGRGTRVWKAVQIEGDETVGGPVVLKDSWVDAHREREGDNDARIRKSALSLGEVDRTRLTGMMLTILGHGDVRIGEMLDRTPLLESSRKRKRGATPSEGQAHYRVVYQEVCRSLRDETSLPVIFDALVDICGGLYALHHCGWVHGDISADNLLLHGNRAILSDLEYARCRTEIVEHDETGTRAFMPVEVQMHRYLFIPCKEAWSDTSDSDLDASQSTIPPRRRSRRERRLLEPRRAILDVAFRYNPRHDLEAIWWVALFFVITRVVSEAVATGTPLRNDEQIREQRLLASRLFSGSDYRLQALIIGGWLAGELDKLHPTIADAVWVLEDARNRLIKSYTKLEEDYTEAKEFDVPLSIYTFFRSIYHKFAEELRPANLTVTPLEDY